MIKQARKVYAAPDLEAEVQKFWGQSKAYDRTREHRATNERFYFVDGPPYTTGNVHVGTAWNKIVKDCVVRWRRMQGYNVRDQPGYDMHGLPIEVQVEKELGITVKKQIEELGIGRFVETCRQYATGLLGQMTDQFKRLGVWLDWEHPYITIANGYIETAWWTLGRAQERGLLYRAERNLEWCPRCETPLATHEIEFYDEADPSIYVMFPLKGKQNESLLIWTTTPWTLPANMAIAVHPNLNYAKVRVGGGDATRWVWIVKDNVDAILGRTDLGGYEIAETLPGSSLVGWAYDHPLVQQVPYQAKVAGQWVHRVLASDTVSPENSGLVHMAPGHGPEDFEICTRVGIPAFCPVDERGHFTAEAGKYAGRQVREANAAILEDLRGAGALLHQETITHRYGHCWRCKTPLIYRVTIQWFLAITQVKPRMLEEIRRVKWYPDWAGSAREYDWVLNARDWTISRQRYWGIPLPVWVCGVCKQEKLVTSADGLQGARGYKGGMDLHRPWIDDVLLTCSACGGEMRRIPDVLDVWFDSAVASWADLEYPRNKEEFERWWPSRWITEAPDQTRGWFYSQLGAGVVAFERAPYDSVLMHGWALDAQGRPMHKSLGNVVDPFEVARELGVDALRLYYLRGSAPWEDIHFQVEEVKTAQRNLNILWNVHRFATLYMSLDRFDPGAHPLEALRAHLRPEDRWLLSRLEAVEGQVGQEMEAYNLHRAARAIEAFVVDDLSRWYVKLIRDRTWLEGEEPSKLAAYRVLHDALLAAATLLAPFCPHVAEAMYQDLGGRYPTVHMEDWPRPMGAHRDAELERSMAAAQGFVEAASRARQKRGLPLRWPVARVVIRPTIPDSGHAASSLRELILDQVNAKDLVVLEPGDPVPGSRFVLRANQKALGTHFRGAAPDVQKALEEADPRAVAAALASGGYRISVRGGEALVGPDMVAVDHVLPENLEAAASEAGEVFVDFTRAPELEAEGFAREVVRRVQEMRKELDLDVEDYIDLWIRGSEALEARLRGWRDYISRETRARGLHLVRKNLQGEVQRRWDFDEEGVTIGLTPLRVGALLRELRGVQGVTVERALTLYQAGLATREALAAATPRALAELPGWNLGEAEAFLRRLRQGRP